MGDVRSFVAIRVEVARRFAQDFFEEGGLRLALTILAFVGAGGVAFSLFEAGGQPLKALKGLWDGIWWAFVTTTTLGYGDVVPKTLGGRVAAIVLMFSGVVFLSLITATIASVMVERKTREGKGLGTTEYSRHVVVCGWNEHGPQVLEGLAAVEEGAEVALVNELEEHEFAELELEFPRLQLFFVRGDFTHESVLKRAGIERARYAIILADTTSASAQKADDRTVLGALAVKALNPNVRLSAEIENRENVPHLRRALVDEIVAGGDFVSHMLTAAVLSPGISDAMRELVSWGPTGLARRRLPSSFVGKTFRQLCDHFRGHGLLTLGIISELRQVTLEEMLEEGSSFVEDFVRDTFKEAEMEDYLKGGETNVQVHLNPPDDHVLAEGDWAITIGR
jgi:voltage-gated potassium channel